MIPRIPADTRAEIVRLRGERLTYPQIAQVTGVAAATVALICRDYFGNQVKRAQAALRREVALARSERLTSPPFHPAHWG